MFPYSYHMTGWGAACAGFGVVVLVVLLAIGAVTLIGVAVWNHDDRRTGARATAARDDATHGI